LQKVDVLFFSDLPGGHAPFEHGDLRVVFHRLSRSNDLPPAEENLWAFVDWVLPDISGLELCRRLRCNSLTAEAHITMLLDEDGDTDARRRALKAGADDYMVGQVSRAAILDRILSVNLQEPNDVSGRLLSLGELVIDLAAFRACWRGRPIPLTPNEFYLLSFLVKHPGRVFTRAQLIAALGKQEPALQSRTVDVWMGRLRRALQAAGVGDPLRTVRSQGYLLEQPGAH
jgi:two-component system phosphate regulon response regulator PhoB